MKRVFLVLLIAVACIAGWICARRALAQTEAAAVSPHLVVSQFQAGGGSATDEFIEIKNTGASPIDLSGYVVVYRSQNGTDDGSPMASWSTSTTLDPGKFYLIAAHGS